jgi:hypothetical protein
MRLWQSLALLAALGWAPPLARAASGGAENQGATVELRNRLVSFEFSRSEGSLLQITDLKTGYAWLSPSAPRRLAKLIQRTPEKSSNILLSNSAGSPETSLDGDTLVMRFHSLRDGPIDTGVRLTVTVRLPEDSPEAFFSIEVANHGSSPLEELWFPFVAGRSGGGGDVFTTSHGTERDLYHSFRHGTFDTHAFGEHLQRIGLTAGHMLPMMDVSNPQGGLSYIKYEQKPRPTDFAYENLTCDPEHVELGWAWATPIMLQAGRTYKSCEFGVGVHQSDWHATADRLRRFMDAWWRPSPMSAALKEKIGVYQVQIRAFSGERYHDFDELPAMARDCEKYGVKDITFWDPTASVYVRPDAAGDYWEMPPDREQMLRRALREVKAMGFQVSACVNYRLVNVTSRAWARIGSEAQYSVWGVPLYGNVPGSMNGAIYNAPNYEMGTRSLCQGTEKFAQFARDLTRQTLDLGLTSIFIDQAFEPNYALPKDPGGLDPFEAMDRTYGWFADASKMARARDPQAYSIGEVPDIWNTPSIDVWWMWGWNTPNWPTPEVFMYLMPEVCFIWCTDEYQLPLLPKAFAMGSFLAIGTRGLTGLISDEPTFGAHIAHLAALRSNTAPFVARGRFLDNRGLRMSGADGFVFVSKEGLAITLANGRPEAVDVTVRFRPGALTKRPVGDGRLYLEDGTASAAAPGREGEERNLRLRLDGYSAAVWTLPYADESRAKS